MFAVIKTGGKQYRVAADDVISVAKVAGAQGDIVQLGEVILLGGDTPQFGSPTVSGASVAAEVVEQGRGPKVIAFKKRRRQNSRRKRGYRHEFSVIRITEILTDGAAPSKPARERKPKKAPVEAADAEDGAEAKPAAKAKAKAKPAAKAKSAAKPKAAAKKPAKGSDKK
jgi:large subunit ribosomal protein L21